MAVFAPVSPASAQPVTQPTSVDANLVPGLRLPVLHNLPTATTPGTTQYLQMGPPKAGSFAAKADLAAVQGAQLLRTRAGDTWARHMDENGTSRIWFDLAKRARATTGKVQGWLDTALLASTLAGNAAVTYLAKSHFDRPRPFQVDSRITPPFKHPRTSSFPSGHASSAFAAARVIAKLSPQLATEAYALATQVAVSRVYAGVHFPSDVLAGAALGTAVAEAALRVGGRRGAAEAAVQQLMIAANTAA